MGPEKRDSKWRERAKPGVKVERVRVPTLSVMNPGKYPCDGDHQAISMIESTEAAEGIGKAGIPAANRLPDQRGADRLPVPMPGGEQAEPTTGEV